KKRFKSSIFRYLLSISNRQRPYILRFTVSCTLLANKRQMSAFSEFHDLCKRSNESEQRLLPVYKAAAIQLPLSPKSLHSSIALPLLLRCQSPPEVPARVRQVLGTGC